MTMQSTSPATPRGWKALPGAFAATGTVPAAAARVHKPLVEVWDRLRAENLLPLGTALPGSAVPRIVSEYPLHRDAGTVALLAAELGCTRVMLHRHAQLLEVHEASPPPRAFERLTPEVARGLLERFRHGRGGVGEWCLRRGYSVAEFSTGMERALGDEYRQVVLTKRRPNTSRLGRSLEWRVRDVLVGAGYRVMRAAASRGAADFIAVRRDGNLMVQVRRGGFLAPAEWNELIELAEAGRMTAVLVSSPLGGELHWYRLTGPKDGAGGRQPMEPWAVPEWSADETGKAGP
jgi:hypothetical protein